MSLTTIIIPVKNEEANIAPLVKLLEQHLPDTAHEVIFVDDGSDDNTLTAIAAVAGINKKIKCLSLSRNFGHQNALMAGMMHAAGDKIILMDGDLQHPPELVPILLQKLDEGYDIVNTSRVKTKNVGSTKTWMSKVFYTFLNSISDTDIKYSVADFRAFNKKVLKAILLFEERELFIRGIFSWIGYNQTTILYEPAARLHGKTKYSYGKMFSLALKGTTSFSFKPLRIAILVGAIVSFAAFAFAIFALIEYFKGNTVPGWASTIITSMLLGGTQLLAIGLLGEYIASLFTETKKRPLFLVDKKINLD